eukprot:2403759-Rhodomonas_salina.2
MNFEEGGGEGAGQETSEGCRGDSPGGHDGRVRRRCAPRCVLKAESQYTWYQGCVFLHLISGCSDSRRGAASILGRGGEEERERGGEEEERRGGSEEKRKGSERVREFESEQCVSSCVRACVRKGGGPGGQQRRGSRRAQGSPPSPIPHFSTADVALYLTSVTHT